MIHIPSKVTYQTKSICDCGETVLHDHVPLLSQYEVLIPVIATLQFTCGRCKKQQHLAAVFVKSKDGATGWLPLAIFNLEEEITTLTA